MNELDYCLNKVGVSSLIMPRNFKQSNYIEIVRQLVPAQGSSTTIHSDRYPELRHLILMDEVPEHGMLPFEELYRNHSTSESEAVANIAKRTRFEEAANIQFTSGTTGYPKGATLSHHNLLNNAYFIGELMRYHPEERICVPVPLYHCLGMVNGNLGALCFGSSVIYPCEGYDVHAALSAVENQMATVMISVPTMWVAMLE